MHRTVLTLVLALAALAPAAPSAVARPPVLAQALLVSCESALDRSAREAVFEGRVRALRGAAKFGLRFTLERLDSSSGNWTPVVAEGFDEWKSADVGVRRYVLTKAVANLSAPASYRVTVRFRWFDAGGRILTRRKLVSPVCKQPDLRPDLRVAHIDAVPIDASQARYTVLVRNTGRTGAGPFDLVLNVDGADRPALSFTGLGAGDRVAVEITGPPCSAGSAVTATADAGTAVDEAVESNNVFGRLCPVAGAA